MATVDDQATEVEEFERQLAIQNQLNAPRMRPKGACYYCDEPLAEGALFCDSGCCHDFEMEQAAKKRNGRR